MLFKSRIEVGGNVQFIMQMIRRRPRGTVLIGLVVIQRQSADAHSNPCLRPVGRGAFRTIVHAGFGSG